MGNVLHDWDEAQMQALISKAYEALPSGGILVAIENIIDDDRRANTFGLLMSLRSNQCGHRLQGVTRTESLAYISFIRRRLAPDYSRTGRARYR